MATRTAVARVVAPHQPAWAAAVARRMEGAGGRGRVARYFSDGTGRVLSEEERAAENVYIQKMEREKLEKLRRKADKDKADAAKRATAAKGDKKGGEARPT
uniref:ATPase inhibitor n=1 Tax=Oryza punctata TaxID=4537 RepID=A0A0E0K0N2_ORYPU